MQRSNYWWDNFYRETGENWADEVRDDVIDECAKNGGKIFLLVIGYSVLKLMQPNFKNCRKVNIGFFILSNVSLCYFALMKLLLI